MPVDNPSSTLLYGGPGVGKTAPALSSFYDWKNKPLIGDGKLITFGRENNAALALPDECRQTPGGGSLRFSSPTLDSLGWLDRFEAAANGLLVAAKKGVHLDALVVDGMSEFDLLFEAAFKGDKWDKWDELLNRAFAVMTRLDPEALGCDVFLTARVMEKKKSKSGGRTTMAGDPDFLNFDYYPSMRGSFRLHLPHYFNLVLYMETEQRRVTQGPLKGRMLPAHVLNMVRTGEFYVKNQWEYDWIRAGLPLQLLNPDWVQVKDMLNGLATLDTTKENYVVPDSEDFATDPNLDIEVESAVGTSDSVA